MMSCARCLAFVSNSAQAFAFVMPSVERFSLYSAQAASAASKASDGDFKKAFTVKGGSPALNEMQLHLEEEVGDLFLALVNYSRWLNVDPCVAVDRANRKFYDRFSFVEKSMKQNSIPMTKDNCADMIRFWNDAKNKEYR